MLYCIEKIEYAPCLGTPKRHASVRRIGLVIIKYMSIGWVFSHRRYYLDNRSGGGQIRFMYYWGVWYKMVKMSKNDEKWSNLAIRGGTQKRVKNGLFLRYIPDLAIQFPKPNQV